MEAERHLAKKWVEDHFPTVTGTMKAMLILAYGAGMDKGMSEIQDLLEDAVTALAVGKK